MTTEKHKCDRLFNKTFIPTCNQDLELVISKPFDLSNFNDIFEILDKTD